MKNLVSAMAMVLSGVMAASLLSILPVSAKGDAFESMGAGITTQSAAEKQVGAEDDSLLWIETADQMIALMNRETATFKISETEMVKVKAEWNVNYILKNDIDLKEKEKMHEIGTKNSPFTGKFDGKGHKIFHMQIGKKKSGDSYHGLFGYTENAAIKNIIVKYSSVYGCCNTGGIIGKMNGGSLSNCTFAGTVNVSFPKFRLRSEVYNYGGIVGKVDKSSDKNATAQVYQCQFEGSLSLDNREIRRVGRLGKNSIVQECANMGAISLDAGETGRCCTEIGGVVGMMDANSSIGNCWSKESISVKLSAGFVFFCPSIASSLGGLVGHVCQSGKVSDCFTLSGVQKNSNYGKCQICGGLIGVAEGNSTISCCCYCKDTKGKFIKDFIAKKIGKVTTKNLDVLEISDMSGADALEHMDFADGKYVAPPTEKSKTNSKKYYLPQLKAFIKDPSNLSLFPVVEL